MQDDHLTLRRQKGFHLHCVCALHPDLCLTVQQSPWAVAAHRANLTLIFPGRLKQKVRSVALTESLLLLQAGRMIRQGDVFRDKNCVVRSGRYPAEHH